MLLTAILACTTQSEASPQQGSEWRTDFSRHTVPLEEIVPGGPPKDGIPALDRPRFETVRSADKWLADREPVIVVEHGAIARAYPLQILVWHEIVNDHVGDLAVAVTFCPLCNTALVFDRRHGPFVKTVIMRDAVTHNFPMPHPDYLTQTIRHRVPADRVDDLFEYDGSVYVHRTRGELSAQCDLEAMNFLALNLAHDVAMGSRTVADARAFYARTAMAFKRGDKSSPYVNGLIFQQEPNAADPDHQYRM